MFNLLAAAEAMTQPDGPVMRAADVEPVRPDLVSQIYNHVVTGMPPGGLRMLFLLLVLTLAVSLYALWGQRRLAQNQVRLAEMLEQHAREHDKGK